MPNRIIRDALLDSERYLELTHDSERLLFLELLLCMDDYGLVPVNFSVLRRRTSVCASKTKEQVLKMLSALADVDLIRVYEHDGSRYAYVPRTRSRPQSIKPKWPMPPASLGADAIEEAQKSARNLGRQKAQIEVNQALSATEHCGNTVRTVCERPNTNTNTKTSTKTSTSARNTLDASHRVQHPPETQPLVAELEADVGRVAHAVEKIKVERPRGDPSSSVPDCPYAAIVATFHDECPSLARVEIIGAQRQSMLRQRWREVCAAEKFDAEQGIDWFRQYFRIVSASRFLMGQVQRRGGDQQSPWRASFDWLIKPANFIKVLEGTYSNERGR